MWCEQAPPGTEIRDVVHALALPLEGGGSLAQAAGVCHHAWFRYDRRNGALPYLVVLQSSQGGRGHNIVRTSPPVHLLSLPFPVHPSPGRCRLAFAAPAVLPHPRGASPAGASAPPPQLLLLRGGEARRRSGLVAVGARRWRRSTKGAATCRWWCNLLG